MPDIIYIVVWYDENEPSGFNAQAYSTREAALRDFPQFAKNIIESTVQS